MSRDFSKRKPLATRLVGRQKKLHAIRVHGEGIQPDGWKPDDKNAYRAAVALGVVGAVLFAAFSLLSMGFA
jgi:hypothetical protein